MGTAAKNSWKLATKDKGIAGQFETINGVSQYVPFDAGWYVSQVNNFSDIVVDMYDLFERCNINFYM